MERRSNYEVVCRAHGRVLIAGLGLGLVLVPMLAKPEVVEVTVVEREPDVIELVGPAFAAALASGRLRLVQADIHAWRPADDERFQTIYFDIWPTISTEHLPEMDRLRARLRPWLAAGQPGSWLGAWQEARLRAERREGTRPW
jgi:spermidine synthase